MDKINLENDKNDITVMIIKSLTSCIPYIGGPIAEIIGYVIPNQRLDRLSQFVEKLKEKVDDIDDKINERSKSDPLFLDFFEDELTQVSRATTEERIEYLSNILISGIDTDEADLLAAKQLLRILSQLNDAEIIWLKYYNTDHADREGFIEKHSALLRLIPRYMTMDDEDYRASVIQESYKQRLEELHLVEPKIKFVNKTGLPKINFLRSGFEKSSIQITPLGRQLIEIITDYSSDLEKQQSINNM